MRRLLFTLGISIAGRFFIWLDKRAGLPRPLSAEQEASATLSRHSVVSGRNVLDACFACPAGEAPRAALLLCHGIGETVEHWRAVQCLLAQHGIASLIFNYSGYGRSTGWPGIKQFEQDAHHAYALLTSLTPEVSVSLLGFSLGTGVATALAPRVAAHRLVLVSGFTSLRDAASYFGVPALLGRLVPAAWENERALSRFPVPLLIVHGLKDGLFPPAMAERLAASSNPPHELILVSGLSHDDLIYHPTTEHWLPIIGRIVTPLERETTVGAA